ncbi:hypothetical protein [Streptomyces catenulae]|uniref:Secreted protein n=1 Tax=Streptomyces catenulae TaxID=66875 RepID=A0ABV2YZ93_9ACTN|nr:hypothetical protein [Streptomyces catenulae]
MTMPRLPLTATLLTLAGIGAAHLAQNIRHDRARNALAQEKLHQQLMLDTSLDADPELSAHIRGELKIRLIAVMYRTHQIPRTNLYLQAREAMFSNTYLPEVWQALHPTFGLLARDRTDRLVNDAFHTAYEEWEAAQRGADGIGTPEKYEAGKAAA